MEKIKLLLVDDQQLFVESLRTVLTMRTKEVTVVGVACNGREAVRLVDRERPDVVLMDVRMPEMDGVESTRLIMGRYPRTRVLMLTTFDDDEYIIQALRVGAAGYLLKDMPPAELIAAVLAVHKGSVLMSPRIAAKLVGKLLGPVSEIRDMAGNSGHIPIWLNDLSLREKQILGLMARGHDNKEIARRLYIVEQTVKNHVSVIYAKIGARDRVQASLMAIEAGLDELDGSHG